MTDPEELDDLLADVPDLSVREPEEALQAAMGSETIEDLGPILEEADEALRELQKDVKALRRRTAKAAGLDPTERRAKAKATAEKLSAAKKAAKATAKKAKGRDTLQTLLDAVEPLTVEAIGYTIVVAESVENLSDLDANLEEAEVAIGVLVAAMRPLRTRVEKAMDDDDDDDDGGSDDDGSDDGSDDDDDDDDDD